MLFLFFFYYSTTTTNHTFTREIFCVWGFEFGYWVYSKPKGKNPFLGGFYPKPYLKPIYYGFCFGFG